MSFAFVFPGQGSQSVGMMAAYGDAPVVRATFDEASAALGDDLGTAPVEGARYSISYFSNPRFVVVDPGFPRSSRTIKKQATDTPKQLAIRSIARALWLGEGVA